MMRVVPIEVHHVVFFESEVVVPEALEHEVVHEALHRVRTRFDSQFRDYIRRAVRDAFSSDLTRLPDLSDREIGNVVDETYRNAWELLEVWGDIEE